MPMLVSPRQWGVRMTCRPQGGPVGRAGSQDLQAGAALTLTGVEPLLRAAEQTSAPALPPPRAQLITPL